MSDSTSIKESPVVVSLDPHTVPYEGVDGFPVGPNFTPEQERKLYRKLDLRLLPILTIMYLLASMDSANIGNARLEGLMTQLKLVGNEFNYVLTVSSVAFCLCECPANLLLKKFRPSRWLPGITILWGLTLTLSGLVKTYHQLMGARVFMGMFESGVLPGTAYYLTLWYPRQELQFRMGLFFGGASVALACSGLLAVLIGYMSGIGGLEGWSWLFIVEGAVTVVVGIISLFVLVDYPATATFLTPEERAFLVWKKKNDNYGVSEKEEFALRFFLAALRDWQVWLHIVIYLSIMAPLSGIVLFLPSIIVGFGYTTTVSQLLTIPVYMCGAISTILFGHYSDKWNRRYPFILAGLLQLLVGFSILICNVPGPAKYFGVFLCVAGGMGALPGAMAWLGNNLAGQCKRGVGMAFHIGIGNFSIVIASNIFRQKDAPRYLFGYAMEFMFVGLGIISTGIVVLLYTRINARRNAFAKEVTEKMPLGHGYTVEELREMGDRSPDFRYTL